MKGLKYTWKILSVYKVFSAKIYEKNTSMRKKKWREFEKAGEKRRLNLIFHLSSPKPKKRALQAACPQSKQVFVLLSGWSRAISTAAFEIWDNIAR